MPQWFWVINLNSFTSHRTTLLVLTSVLFCLSASCFAQTVDTLFDTALKELKQGHAEKARDLLEQAAILEPDSAGIYCNLGLAYQNLSNLKQAIVEYKRALKISATMPEALVNIAGCYQSLGNLEEAIKYYTSYLKCWPNAADAQEIKATLKILMTTDTAANKDPSEADYYDSVIANGTYRWIPERLPLKVYIDGGIGVEGYRDSYQKVLLDAFDEWMAASSGKLAYVLVDNLSDASVVCWWTNYLAAGRDEQAEIERGVASVDAQHGNIRGGTIKILLKPMIEGGVLKDEDVKKACMHEVGHVLGLQGHSTNNHDVMYFTVDSPTVPSSLSKRDQATIRKLYRSYPVISEAPIRGKKSNPSSHKVLRSTTPKLH